MVKPVSTHLKRHREVVLALFSISFPERYVLPLVWKGSINENSLALDLTASVKLGESILHPKLLIDLRWTQCGVQSFRNAWRETSVNSMHPFLFFITIHEGWYYFYAEIIILKGSYVFYSLSSLPLLGMSLDKEVGCLETITKPSTGLSFRHTNLSFAAAHSTSLQLTGF